VKVEQEGVFTREGAEAQIAAIHETIGRVIIGQSGLIDKLLIALFSKIPKAATERRPDVDMCFWKGFRAWPRPWRSLP